MTGQGVEYDDWRRWQADGWLPADAPAPEPLITRDQLLATLERLGLEVNPRTLRYWEHEGVLPAPIRRGRRGVTRALYPWWTVDLIWRLKPYRDKGLTLAELPDIMRAEARGLAVGPVARRLYPSAGGAPAVVPPDASDLAVFLAEHAARYPEIIAWATTPPEGPTGYPFLPPAASPDLQRRLAVLVSALAYGWELAGFLAAEAAVVLTDRHGKQIAIPVRLLPPPASGDGAPGPPPGEQPGVG